MIPVVIVLFPAHASVFSLFLVFNVIVTDVPVGEEVLDFKGVHLFFVFDDFHWQVVLLLRNQSGRNSFLEQTNLRDQKLDLPAHLVHGEVVKKEGNPERLLLAHIALGLDIDDGKDLDNLVLADHYLLAQSTLTALVIQLMDNLVVLEATLNRDYLIDDASQ